MTLELRRGQAWLPVLMASRARAECLLLSELVAVIVREGTIPQVRIFVTSGHSFRPGEHHQHNRQHGERQRHEGAMPALARSRGSRHRASRSTCSRRKRSRSSKACERRNEASGAARAQRAPVRSGWSIQPLAHLDLYRFGVGAPRRSRSFERTGGRVCIEPMRCLKHRNCRRRNLVVPAAKSPGCNRIPTATNRSSPRATSRRFGSTRARTHHANTLSAPAARPDVLNDDGVRRLAAAVLQQAISDLDGASKTNRRSAAAFIAREESACWCALAGVNPTAARERLARRDCAA